MDSIHPIKLVSSWLFLLMVISPGIGHADAAQEIAALAASYWEGQLEAHPVMATRIGDKRYDDRLSDNSQAGIEADQQRLEAVLAKARAIDAAELSAADRLTRSALIQVVQGQLDEISCHMEEWVVDPLRGPQVWFMNLPDYTLITDLKDSKNYVRRCRSMGVYVDNEVANLRRGLAAGKTASRPAVEKALEQLDRLDSIPVEEWAMLRPIEDVHEDWTNDDRLGFASDLTAMATAIVKPVLMRYRTFLRDEVLPAARSQDQAGLSFLEDGVECYRKMIRVETSQDKSPEEIHQLGLDQVARFRADLAKLGQKVLGTSDIAEIQKKLRSDPAMHFKTAEEVEAKANEALARARAAIPRTFGILPRADCVVKVMGMHEAPYSTIAYYSRPSSDGSRPGRYMINTYKPETRPRYEAEALAFHEAIPGHHLQIAIQQELESLPAFRKNQGVTAFVEGWALYTERLADEMGLYSSDLDRIGMLSYDAWRACRLVVDTGMHAFGWSRQRAIDYMIENSVLAENNIMNEVDRYLTWPGQALAYKAGQLEILALREEAKQKLGSSFDIRQFHDAVLENGALALPVLREQVEGWIESRAAANGANGGRAEE